MNEQFIFMTECLYFFQHCKRICVTFYTWSLGKKNKASAEMQKLKSGLTGEIDVKYKWWILKIDTHFVIFHITGFNLWKQTKWMDLDFLFQSYTIFMILNKYLLSMDIANINVIIMMTSIGFNILLEYLLLYYFNFGIK